MQELELFLDNPLAYYNNNTADLFLVALGNAYKVNILVFQSNEQKCWIYDLNNNEHSFSCTLYFARRLSPHLDSIVPKTNVVDDIAHKSSTDEDISFRQYVEGKETFLSAALEIKQENVEIVTSNDGSCKEDGMISDKAHWDSFDQNNQLTKKEKVCVYRKLFWS